MYLAHASRADAGRDLTGAEARAGKESQGDGAIIRADAAWAVRPDGPYATSLRTCLANTSLIRVW